MIEVGKSYKLKGKDFILNSPTFMDSYTVQRISQVTGMVVKVIAYKYTASYNRNLYIVELPVSPGPSCYYIDPSWIIDND